MADVSVALPPRLARRVNRVLRPRDAGEVYAYPRAELARLVRVGGARRLAHGYYALVPQRRLGDPRWRPDLNAAALGIGQADYGVEAVALMGVSAARHHGMIPRAVAVAVVAVPKQRPRLWVDDGEVIFVARATGRLDLERVETELGRGWVATVEQTLLDLAARPQLGGLPPEVVEEAQRGLGARADWALVEQLATRQHQPAALRRIRAVGGNETRA